MMARTVSDGLLSGESVNLSSLVSGVYVLFNTHHVDCICIIYFCVIFTHLEN